MGIFGLQRGALRVKIQEVRKRRALERKRHKKTKKYESDERKGELGISEIFSGHRWVYKTIKIGGDATLEKKLNEMGNKGWELVSATPDKGAKLKCIFKRTI